MEKRLLNVALRHGFNDLTLAKWRAFFALRQEFDEAVGTSIYTLLPGVVENTFGFSAEALPGDKRYQFDENTRTGFRVARAGRGWFGLAMIRALRLKPTIQAQPGPTNTLAAVMAAMATERSALVAEPDDQMLGRIGYRETAEDLTGAASEFQRVPRSCRERAAAGAEWVIRTTSQKRTLRSKLAKKRVTTLGRK